MRQRARRRHCWCEASSNCWLEANGSSVSDPTFLTSYDREDQRALTPSVSPDGDWIIFRLRENDLFALYRIRSDGSDLERMSDPSTFVPDEIDWGPEPES